MAKENYLPQEIFKILSKIKKKNSLPLHEPTFKGNEWKYLKNCIDSTFVSSVGEYVNKFEYEISRYTGVKYSICTSNGTSALHLALRVLNVKQNDEVLVPSLSFVACANAISYMGAIPHFIDVSIESLGVCPNKLEDYIKKSTTIKNGFLINKSTKRIIKAIIPMHTFGHPVQIKEILKIAKKFNLLVIEDAAEAIGSFFDNKHVGTFGQIGVLSFNGNKTITTGGGGALLTNNKKYSDLARHLSTTAKKTHKWEFIHDHIAYNYRMPNINAALGCAQLENLEEKLLRKRNLYNLYNKLFKDIDGIYLFKEQNLCKSNYWLQTLILDKSSKVLRDKILDVTNKNGIQTRPIWRPLHLLKHFRNSPKMNLENTINLYNRIINIPSSDNLI
jgi:perosamine synthetase